MALAIPSVRSSSSAVFSMMGTVSVSKNRSVFPFPPIRTPLIISWCEIWNDLASRGSRRVKSTAVSTWRVVVPCGRDIPACCEWVWMQAPASRLVNAFQNSGVHADSFRPCR